MPNQASIELGERRIGQASPTLIIAEIGINHNGDMDLALESIETAAAAGADAVKFQNYRTEDFVPDREITYTYVSQGNEITESQYEMFKRCELGLDDLEMLKAHCDKQGVLFTSTPTNAEGVAQLVALGAPMLKNGSDFLTNLELIGVMGKSGLPTILSTGMATMAEIDEAVSTFRATGNDRLVLLACTSLYPTPVEEAHVARVATLASAFGCVSGFSDHTDGVGAAVAATCLGGRVLEKHFTLDRNLPGPDHRFSIDPDGLRLLVQSVRDAEISIGNPIVGPTKGEAGARRDFRLSCIAAREMPEGHILSKADVGFSRPATGIPPNLLHMLVGRKTRKTISPGTQLALGDFE